MTGSRKSFWRSVVAVQFGAQGSAFASLISIQCPSGNHDLVPKLQRVRDVVQGRDAFARASDGD
jgi:hypothetical protein